MNKQRFFKILSFLGLLFIIWAFIGYKNTVQNRGEQIETTIEVPKNFARYFSNVVTKQRYTPMAAATFMSPEMRRVNWEVFDGNYLLVNFWATWCAPCVLELPSLGKLQKKFEGRGLNVIAISLDTARNQSEIKEFLKNRAIGEFAAYHDDVGEVQKSTFMRGIPTSYLLSPKGEVLYIFEGDANWSSSPSVDFFENLINSDS